MSVSSIVGRTPWPAADPLAGLLRRSKSGSRGTRADQGGRPISVNLRIDLC